MRPKRLHVAAVVILALLMAPGSLWSQGFTFQYIDQELLEIDFGDVSWADFDHDGRMDLVLTGLQDSETPAPSAAVFINQGVIGSISAAGDSVWIQNYLMLDEGLGPVWLSDVGVADIDADGVLELSISGASSVERPYNPSTRLYRLGGGKFQEVPVDVPGVFGGSIDWGDFDNDGDPDLLLTGERESGEYLSAIYSNLSTAGAVEFEDSGIQLDGVSLGDAKFGDYDSDGDLDLVLSGDTGSGFVTKLYRNDGGQYAEVDAGFADIAFSAVDWADYDNDGDLDLLLSGGFLSPLVVEGHSVVYRNDGGDQFVDIGSDLDGQFYGTAKWGDYDNDGRPDVMLSGTPSLDEQRLGRVYRNEENDQFRFAVNLSGLLFSEATLGDYDYDGDLDIVQVGSGITVQYRNDQLRVNEPPSIPEGLSANGAQDGVVLSWSPSTDPQTPSPGLTYNIRIGTSPGGVDILAPMADIGTGRRLVSAMGNAQHATMRSIGDLPAGSYFWSVQALDNAFNPSPWSTEASFTVTQGGGVATDTGDDILPSELEVGMAYPNPFVDRMTVALNIPANQHIRATVFSMLGAQVAILKNGYVQTGRHELRWDGRDAVGREVSAGVYLLRITGAEVSRTIRLTRVHE